MTIDAVAFDLDGTLYPRTLMYVLSLPLLVRHPRLVFHFARVRRAIRRLDDIADFRQTQAALLASRLGMASDSAAALIERVIYGEWMAMLRGIQAFPHVREELEGLRSRGLRLGLMSDYPVDLKLGYLGLEGLWDAVVCSEDCGHLKPHPAAFVRLARDLGAEPARTLYVGDSVDYDVRGAAAVGMRTALLGRHDRRADFCFGSYAGFAGRLAHRFG